MISHSFTCFFQCDFYCWYSLCINVARSGKLWQALRSSRTILESFCNGNAEVRFCVSCENVGSCIVTSLKLCVPFESSTVIAEIKVVLEVHAAKGLANQRPSLTIVSIHACM